MLWIELPVLCYSGAILPSSRILLDKFKPYRAISLNRYALWRVNKKTPPALPSCIWCLAFSIPFGWDLIGKLEADSRYVDYGFGRISRISLVALCYFTYLVGNLERRTTKMNYQQNQLIFMSIFVSVIKEFVVIFISLVSMDQVGLLILSEEKTTSCFVDSSSHRLH